MYKADGLTAIAGALPMEVAGVKALGSFRKARAGRLEYYQGDIRGKGVAVFVSGIGGDGAYHTAESACDALPLVAYISVGLSASLSASLKPGDVVAGESTTALASKGGLQENRLYNSDARLLGIAREALAGEGGVRFGGLIASERVLVKASDKRAVAASSGALALDMETCGAAMAASEAGVPFLAIRAISDGLDEDLPVDFGRFTVEGNMNWPSFLVHVLTHPGCIPPLMRLGRNSRVAAKNIAMAVEKLVIIV